MSALKDAADAVVTALNRLSTAADAILAALQSGNQADIDAAIAELTDAKNAADTESAKLEAAITPTP